MPNVRKLLSYLIEVGAAKDVCISMPTNGTRIDEEIARILGQFGKVKLRLSLDGSGPATEWIRYPSKFAEVSQTPKKLEAFSNVKVSVGFTASALNIFEAGKVAAWADKRGLIFQYGWVDFPRYLVPAVIPASVRQQASTYAVERALELSNPKNRTELRSFARQLVSAQTQDPLKLAEMRAFIVEMDAHRGTSFNDSFPELAAALAPSDLACTIQ